MTEQKQEVIYRVQDEDVKLSPTMVKKYLVNGNGNVTDQEVVMFMQLCKFQKLNPFLNEAYLIKFGNSPAQIITSKEAFMKRADANPHYKGNKAGIIVQRGDELKKLNGAIKLPTDTLLGGWATVERDDRNEKVEVEISMEEFGKNQSTWKSMPMNMIRKTALVNALREAFPENLGSLYTEDDKDLNDTKRMVNAEEKIEEPVTIDNLISDDGDKKEEPKAKDSKSDKKEYGVKDVSSNEGISEEEQQELFKGVGTEPNE
ncbi:phage recombination protein Bet [Lactobacillus sp. S2-2]|uniref:phage recombination protein Bet n=1 Tax=Lactobacillus sp. S2-2 TaxID=2692917 RepID=UPI001F030CC6|nr:phage recombination protein Bet [Lactobacillus sp. S2-2]MCF6515516.1 phage recombination protein Bet [Lactobacillus sp. S2-2]